MFSILLITTTCLRTYSQTPSGLALLLHNAGVKSWSPSTAVCILKNCAERVVNEELEKKKKPLT